MFGFGALLSRSLEMLSISPETFMYDLILLVLLFFWALSAKEGENVGLKNIIYKFILFLDGLSFMIYSNDGKGIGPKYNNDSKKIKALNADSKVVVKTIIFIRHGESDWNSVFNKGINLSFPYRVVKSLFTELSLFLQMDSIFIDSPLNSEGIEQAVQLREFIFSSSSSVDNEIVRDGIKCLRGEKSSAVCCSTLRRAAATTILALWPRLHPEKEDAEKADKAENVVHLLSSLQEISRNIDTYSLSAMGSLADLPHRRLDKHCKGLDQHCVFDVSENFGNKSRSFYGIKRLRSFADWAFKREESCVIVGGHSLWFKYFFQSFLPPESTHISKNKKMVNSGVIIFNLIQAIDTNDSNNFLYLIEEKSINTIYGGFEK